MIFPAQKTSEVTTGLPVLQTATAHIQLSLSPAAGTSFCSERWSHRILVLLQVLLPQVRSNLLIQLRLSPRQLCQLLDDIESASAIQGCKGFSRTGGAMVSAISLACPYYRGPSET